MPDVLGSANLQKLIKNYHLIKDSNGQSPSSVFKLSGKIENLYLKCSDIRYHGTSFDVEREKEVLVWLKDKLPVPDVLYFEDFEDKKYLLMSEVEGLTGDKDFKTHQDPKKLVQYYSDCVNLLTLIDIKDCPFDNRINTRLVELDVLLEKGLADIDSENWEEDTPFKLVQDLIHYLKENKPAETVVFSHGDLGDTNFFVRNNQLSGFIDLGRAGKADLWQDIALCVRSIQHDFGEDSGTINLFFEVLGIKPDWEKIKYYILLDELF